MSYFNPVNSKVLTVLAPVQANALKIWSTNHSNLFDLRIHTMKTCPFLVYTPAYLTKRNNTIEWANFLYEFFKNKHLEENHCNCG